jgi:hypothetical protein
MARQSTCSRLINATILPKSVLLAVAFFGLHTELLFGQYLIPPNPRVERGATIGGITGAVIGGVIGHQNDETPEGALIGGAVGAIAGGLIGNAQNQREAELEAARRGYYQSNQSNGYTTRTYPNYYQQRQQPGGYYQQRPIRQPVGVTEIIAMSRRGLPDSVIIQHIQTNGVRSAPTTEELIRMYDEGVSSAVIETAQQSAISVQQTTVDGRVTNSGTYIDSSRTTTYPSSNIRPSTVRPQSRVYRRRF